jgi:SAM-dependent methyltransferase
VPDTLYSDPAYYRMLFDRREHDLPFYLALAAEADGPILELGIGAGRVALALARAGYAVTGIDRSTEMLSSLAVRAETERPEVRSRLYWHHGDATELRLGTRFALVIYPFNGLAHHHRPADLAALFASVHQHLAHGGIFAFDVLLPDPVLLRGESSTIPWFRHPATGEVCRCDEDVSYDEAARLLTIRTTIRFMERERPTETLELVVRQYFADETPTLLARAGFELDRSVDLGDSLGYVCRPRA